MDPAQLAMTGDTPGSIFPAAPAPPGAPSARWPWPPIAAQLKTSYRDGTALVVFQPLDFIARLAARSPGPG